MNNPPRPTRGTVIFLPWVCASLLTFTGTTPAWIIATAAAGFVTFTAARHATREPANRTSWTAFAISNAFSAAASTILLFDVPQETALLTRTGFYTGLAVFLVWLNRPTRNELAAAVDVIAVITVGGVLTWQLLTTETGNTVGAPVALLLPVCGLIVIALIVRLLTGTPDVTRPVAVLTAAVLVSAAADLTFTTRWDNGTPLGTVPASGFTVTAALLYWFTRDPKTQNLAYHDATRAALHPARILLLGFGLVALPVLAVASPTNGQEQHLFTVLTVVLGSLFTVLLITAIRDRDRITETLSWEATHDTLTGLANRPAITDAVTRICARHHRDRQPAALLLVDLDGFKEINDTWGHDTGDRLLREIAIRFRTVVRPSDVIARIGGDEFAVLLEPLTHPNEAFMVAERIIGECAKPVNLENVGETRVSGSVGVAILTSGDTPESLFRHADTAMYRAKKTGKNRWDVWDEPMRTAARTRREMEAALRQAPGAGQLRLTWQPIIRLSDRAIFTVEASLRWEHPTRGTLLPEDFLPLTEGNGLLPAIGTWTLTETLRVVTAHPELPGVLTAVTAQHLATGQIPGFLTSHPHRPTLIVELPEPAITKPGTRFWQNVEDIRNTGTLIAVNGFETIHVDTLRTLRPVLVKLPARFTTPPIDEPFVSSLITMIHAIGAEAVAVNVTTPQQAAALHRLGCDYAQGPLWATLTPGTPTRTSVPTTMHPGTLPA